MGTRRTALHVHLVFYRFIWLIVDPAYIQQPLSECRKILGDWRSFPACNHLTSESGVPFGTPYFFLSAVLCGLRVNYPCLEISDHRIFHDTNWIWNYNSGKYQFRSMQVMFESKTLRLSMYKIDLSNLFTGLMNADISSLENPDTQIGYHSKFSCYSVS